MRKYRLMAGWLLIVMAVPGPARAWSDFVHASICEQAYQRSSPPARQLVAKLTRGENQPEGYTGFGQACVWPDEVRRTTHHATYEYHFINVPRGETLDPQRDCAAHDCVTQAVRRYAIYLSQPTRLDWQRAEALRFLGHFVGDLHQPLHVGYREDRGGNDIHVFWQDGAETDRLHGIWDGRIPADLGLLEATTVQALLAEITPQQEESWLAAGLAVEAWAQESFSLARDQVYRDAGGAMLTGGERLGEAYLQRATPIVRQRIQQAVIRLTAILERAAQGPMGVEDFNAPAVKP